jgi:hypothetical protein
MIDDYERNESLRLQATLAEYSALQEEVLRRLGHRITGSSP